MKEQIYTIPINEAFGSPGACPICTLFAKADADAVEYVVGAAMMDPDTRLDTNEYGFCSGHFSAMLRHKNRLSVALTIESHMAEFLSRHFDEKALSEKQLSSPFARIDKLIDGVEKQISSCFVCRRVDDRMEHYYQNLVFMWKSEPEFRKKLRECEFFCFPHMYQLLKHGQKLLSKKELPAFTSDIYGATAAYAEGIRMDLSAFCNSFDYRSAGTPLSEAQKLSIERAGILLNGVQKLR